MKAVETPRIKLFVGIFLLLCMEMQEAKVGLDYYCITSCILNHSSIKFGLAKMTGTKQRSKLSIQTNHLGAGLNPSQNLLMARTLALVGWAQAPCAAARLSSSIFATSTSLPHLTCALLFSRLTVSIFSDSSRASFLAANLRTSVLTVVLSAASSSSAFLFCASSARLSTQARRPSFKPSLITRLRVATITGETLRRTHSSGMILSDTRLFMLGLRSSLRASPSISLRLCIACCDCIRAGETRDE